MAFFHCHSILNCQMRGSPNVDHQSIESESSSQKEDRPPVVQLSATDIDALKELINVAYGRAAGALSALLDEYIVLTAPVAQFLSIDGVGPALENLVGPQVSSVHQIFSGSIAGHALILFDAEAVEVLMSLLPGGGAFAGTQIQSDALAELGNVVLQSAIGICGDVLNVDVRFSVPNVSVKSVGELLASLVLDGRQMQVALVIQTRFEVARRQLYGHLAIILGVTSFTCLLERLAEWDVH